MIEIVFYLQYFNNVTKREENPKIRIKMKTIIKKFQTLAQMSITRDIRAPRDIQNIEHIRTNS